MKITGVLIYGVIIMALSFVAGGQQPDGFVPLDGLFAMAVNWVFLVLPVILVRNWRARRRAKHAAAPA